MEVPDKMSEKQLFFQLKVLLKERKAFRINLAIPFTLHHRIIQIKIFTSKLPRRKKENLINYAIFGVVTAWE